jgi:hypothetical protein
MSSDWASGLARGRAEAKHAGLLYRGSEEQARKPPPRPAYTVGDVILLDAKLAGLKAGLKLTPDQEKLWEPFEAAVRDAVKMRMEHMRAMMDGTRGMMGEDAERRSPVDRIEMMAAHMSEAASALTKIADAAKPFYASLDDSQKRIFGWLGRELLMMGRGHPGMGMMSDEGMSMMRQGTGAMRRGPDDDSSDDEQ